MRAEADDYNLYAYLYIKDTWMMRTILNNFGALDERERIDEREEIIRNEVVVIVVYGSCFYGVCFPAHPSRLALPRSHLELPELGLSFLGVKNKREKIMMLMCL